MWRIAFVLDAAAVRRGENNNSEGRGGFDCLEQSVMQCPACLSLCREGRGRLVEALRGSPRHPWSLTRPTNALISDNLTGRDRGHPSLLRGSESRLRSVPQSLDRSHGFGKDGVQAVAPIAIAPIQAKMSRQSNEDAPTCDLPGTTWIESPCPYHLVPTPATGRRGLYEVLANSAICRYLYGTLPPRSRRPLCPLSKS